MGAELGQLDKGLHLRQPILGDGDLERSRLDSRRRRQGTERARHGEIHCLAKKVTRYLLLTAVSQATLTDEAVKTRGAASCAPAGRRVLQTAIRSSSRTQSAIFLEADEMTRRHCCAAPGSSMIVERYVQWRSDRKILTADAIDGWNPNSIIECPDLMIGFRESYDIDVNSAFHGRSSPPHLRLHGVPV